MRFLKLLVLIFSIIFLFNCEEKYNKFLTEDEIDDNSIDNLQEKIEELKENSDELSNDEIQEHIDNIKKEIDKTVENSNNNNSSNKSNKQDSQKEPVIISNVTSSESSNGIITQPDENPSMDEIKERAETLKNALDELAKDISGNNTKEKIDESFCDKPIDNKGAVPPNFTTYEKCVK